MIITLHCSKLARSETILRTKCGWHQQMKCHGGDESYHQSFLLRGLTNTIFTTSPLTNRTRLFSKPAAFYFYGRRVRAVTEGASPDCWCRRCWVPSPHLLFLGFQHGAINQAPEVKCYCRHCCVINCMGNAQLVSNKSILQSYCIQLGMHFVLIAFLQG